MHDVGPNASSISVRGSFESAEDTMTITGQVQVRVCAFALWVLLLGAGVWELQRHYNIQAFSDLSSQAILLPALAGYLVWSERERIFSNPTFSKTATIRFGVLAAGIFVGAVCCVHQGAEYVGAILLFFATLLLAAAGFAAVFGTKALRQSTFPFAMLLLMIPLPAIVVDKTIGLLQIQSAWLAANILSATGTPVYREGILIFVPGATIEVAKECSGINSSIALLITMLVVTYRTLNANWRRFLLLAFSIPLSIVKNAIRIAALTLLAIRVDPNFLTGRLHHEGGFVFYLIALLLIYPVWKLLKKGDDKDFHVSPRGSSTGSVGATSTT